MGYKTLKHCYASHCTKSLFFMEDSFAGHRRKSTGVNNKINDAWIQIMLAHCDDLLGHEKGTETSSLVICAFPEMTSQNVCCEKKSE